MDNSDTVSGLERGRTPGNMDDLQTMENPKVRMLEDIINNIEISVRVTHPVGCSSECFDVAIENLS